MIMKSMFSFFWSANAWMVFNFEMEMEHEKRQVLCSIVSIMGLPRQSDKWTVSPRSLTNG